MGRKVEVVFTKGKFVCKCSFEHRLLPKRAGFIWSNAEREWYTRECRVAAQLLDHCDEIAKKEISKSQIVVKPWTGGLSIPENEKLLDFQKEAALFALSRNRSYLALDPGLGKTPIAAVIAKTLNDKYPIGIVYICPPFLTRNTENEFLKWAPGLPVERYTGGGSFAQILIVPDSIINREQVQNDIRYSVEFRKDKNVNSLLIVDEAHRFKNGTAQRTKALFTDIASQFDRIVYLSGTPMPNRPIELFPVLNHSAAKTIDHKNYFQYGMKYCDGFRDNYGWDFSGASNLDELREKIVGTFMLRFKKDEVLKELPPKIEDMVLLDHDLSPKLAKLDRDILKLYSPEDIMEGKIKLELETQELHLATYRRELGIAKIEPSLAYIKYLLEETDEALLVFAHHKEVIGGLFLGLARYNPVVITGKTPMDERHEIVKLFQNDSARRVFIGNIQAAGTGLTLTKANRVVFVEFSWVPADNEQASDRAHRIGQKDTVFVQYLVFKNSIDRMVLETVLRKRKVIEKI